MSTTNGQTNGISGIFFQPHFNVCLFLQVYILIIETNDQGNEWTNYNPEFSLRGKN